MRRGTSSAMAHYLEERALIGRVDTRIEGCQRHPETYAIDEKTEKVVRKFGGSGLLHGLLVKGGQMPQPPKRPRRGRPPKAKGVAA